MEVRVLVICLHGVPIKFRNNIPVRIIHILNVPQKK